MPRLTALLIVATALSAGACATSVPISDSWEAKKHRKDPCLYPAESYYYDARTDDENRYLYQCQIMAGVMVHDACLELQSVGGPSSIPALIYALKLYPPTRGANGFSGMVCTTSHCLEALQAITGQRFSADAAEWERWWVAQGNGPVPSPPPKPTP